MCGIASGFFRRLKAWATALHPDCEWSAELRPAIGEMAKPRVTFAPAWILRKRTQVGMVRIYDAIVGHLAPEMRISGRVGPVSSMTQTTSTTSTNPENFTRRLGASPAPRLDAEEVYFPLPANREQRNHRQSHHWLAGCSGCRGRQGQARATR